MNSSNDNLNVERLEEDTMLMVFYSIELINAIGLAMRIARKSDSRTKHFIMHSKRMHIKRSNKISDENATIIPPTVVTAISFCVH